MMDEPLIAYVMLGLMTFLEIVLICMQISKIRSERIFARSSDKMTAVVRSVRRERDFGRTPMYSFSVDAENGQTYTVSGSGFSASMIKEGDTVEIYVPEEYDVMPEDEYYESIISGGEKAIAQLSDGEKERLLEYMKQRTESIYNRTAMLLDRKVPSLTSEGRGLKKEILPGLILIAVMGFFILMFGYFLITGR